MNDKYKALVVFREIVIWLFEFEGFGFRSFLNFSLTCTVFFLFNGFALLANSTVCIEKLDWVCIKKQFSNKSRANGIDESTGFSYLYLASKTGELELVEFLVKKGAQVNKLSPANGETPLHIAAEFGHSKIVKFLLNNKANAFLITPEEKRTVVHKAAISGKVEILDLLSKVGAPIDERDIHFISPLLLACEKGNLEMVKKLVLLGANINNQDDRMDSPLHIASRIRYPELVQFLLEHDANFKALNHNGETPLLAARFPINQKYENLIPFDPEKRTYETIRFLLENDSNPNEYTPDGDSILLGVTRMGYLSCVEILVFFQTDIHHQKKDNSHALYVSVWNDRYDISILLLENGANPDLPGPEGNNSLHISLHKNHTSLARLLTIYGANMNHKDSNLQSPIDIARREKKIKSLFPVSQNFSR